MRQSGELASTADGHAASAAQPIIGKPRSLTGDALRRLTHNKLAVIGLIGTAAFLFVAIFGPYLTPYDYLAQDLYHVSETPSAQHWLGTDDLGRDFLSRIMYGARTAALVAVIVTSFSIMIGVILGSIAAYGGGRTDWLIMRVTDIVMIIPALLLAAMVDAVIKRRLVAYVDALYKQTHWGVFKNAVYLDYILVFGCLALVFWPGYARLIRGQILSLKHKDFVDAARAIGQSEAHIIRRHLIPNALGPIIVAATFGFSGAITLEASLSYLGVGIQPPGASWGNMLSANLGLWSSKPWLVLAPAIVLGIVTLCINFLGDGLIDALDPRRGKR
jgi:ABC-type dipeptide/oligopeptide/nickel transport system permease subunit